MWPNHGNSIGEKIAQLYAPCVVTPHQSGIHQHKHGPAAADPDNLMCVLLNIKVQASAVCIDMPFSISMYHCADVNIRQGHLMGAHTTGGMGKHVLLISS